MFGNILVAIDIEDNDGWWKLLEQALACIDRDSGKLRLLYTRLELPHSWRNFTPANFDVAEQEKSEKKLEEIARLVDFPADRVSFVVRAGSVYDEILQEAESCKADLVVIGPHRLNGLESLLLGSSASAIVRHAKMPVLVVR